MTEFKERVLTERQFLQDLIGFSKVKQHENDTAIIHIKGDKAVSFAKGNKMAWEDVERLLDNRLTKIEEE